MPRRAYERPRRPDCRHRLQSRGASRSLVGAARRDRRQQSVLLFRGHVAGLFRSAAGRGPGALRRQPFVWTVLVGDPVPGHHDRRYLTPSLFLRRRVWGHHAEGCPVAVPEGKLHRDGSAAARRAAHDRVADRRAAEPGENVEHDPRTGDPHPRRPAARRGVRLGRSRLDRADDADAVDAVRLPVRGTADADPLVQRLDREHARRDRDRLGGKARGRAAGDGRLLRRGLEDTAEAWRTARRLTTCRRDGRSSWAISCC